MNYILRICIHSNVYINCIYELLHVYFIFVSYICTSIRTSSFVSFLICKAAGLIFSAEACDHSYLTRAQYPTIFYGNIIEGRIRHGGPLPTSLPLPLPRSNSAHCQGVYGLTRNLATNTVNIVPIYRLRGVS